MRVFEILFPIKLHLNILQLEEYKYSRFIRWIVRNPLKRRLALKKPLVVTLKVKQLVLLYLAFTILIAGVVLGVTGSLAYTLIGLIVILTQPYMGLGIALLLIKPYEVINKKIVVERTRKKILSLKHLRVIAITGSYGKTSTKEILYQLLKDKYRVLRTPESFNTVFGIAKVVDLELDKNYDYFICEMAAYKKGEIKELCYMVPPTYGMLTGVTSAHLERFVSIQNIIEAKFELVEAVKNKNNLVVNLENSYARKELESRHMSVTTVLRAENIHFEEGLTVFDLRSNEKNYRAKTSLFGSSQATNIALAASMALKLGLNLPTIIAKIEKLVPFGNRLVLRKFTGGFVVDNTYSSNVESFKENVKTAKDLKGTKVIVTPGVVELGSGETKIHAQLGKSSANAFDRAVLVGTNKRTEAFADAFGKDRCDFIDDNRKAYFETLNKLKQKFNWIFLENDITQNY